MQYSDLICLILISFKGLTETALWKKAVFDGKHQARYGNVADKILLAEIKRLAGSLPDADTGLSS